MANQRPTPQRVSAWFGTVPLRVRHFAREYDHAGGAIDFFKRVAERNRTGYRVYLVASHPHPEARVEILEKTI